MRVAMVTPYPPKPDGIGEHTRHLVEALDALDDVDVEVVTQRGEEPADGRVGRTVPVHRVLSADPRRLRSATAAMRTISPDVIHHQFAIPALGVAGLGALVATARVRRSTGVRVVVTLHEVRRELDLLGGFGRLVHRRIVSLADVVVVHTDEVRDLVVRECGADPSSVVVTPLGALAPGGAPPTGSDLEAIRDRYEITERPVALCFGYLHPDKGIEHLVDAAAIVRARANGYGGECDVIVAGAVRPRSGIFRYFERADHEYEQRLRDRVERLELGARVRFVGFVPGADIAGLFALARTVVMPCTKVTQSSVLGTATAAGVPVIASDLPGLRDALGDGGVLVPPADPAALADGMEAELCDPGRAADLAARQRRRAAGIDITTVARALRCSAYEALVEDAPASRRMVVVDGG